jgi:hypothetical protein
MTCHFAGPRRSAILTVRNIRPPPGIGLPEGILSIQFVDETHFPIPEGIITSPRRIL